MNPLPLLDGAAPPAATRIARLPNHSPSDQPFGCLLDQATQAAPQPPARQRPPTSDPAVETGLAASDSSIVDDGEEALAPGKPVEPEKETPSASFLPLLCLYTPPPTVPWPGPELVAVPVGLAPAISSHEPLADVPELPTQGGSASAETPSGVDGKAGLADAPLTLAAAVKPVELPSPAKADSRQAPDAPPARALSEDAPASVLIEKAPIPPPDPKHGMVAAQQDASMRNSEKAAGFAPVMEQILPPRDLSRRSLPESDKISFHGLGMESAPAAEFLGEADAPAKVWAPAPVEVTRLAESIRTEVASLRRLHGEAMSVVLKPDAGTEIMVQLSMNRHGGVEAVARCERGDYQSLSANWGQLQQSLAAHGIRLNPLTDTQSQNHFSSPQQGGAAFADGQTSDRGQQQARAAVFEEELDRNNGVHQRLAAGPSPAKATAAALGWQSWA